MMADVMADTMATGIAAAVIATAMKGLCQGGTQAVQAMPQAYKRSLDHFRYVVINLIVPNLCSSQQVMSPD